MSRPGQAQRLGALAHADVEDPQPLPDREALRDLFLDLPAHEFLADGVAQSAQSLQPQPGSPREALPRRCP
ncbi:hypothetical protein Slala02_75460 [Streptomyces lavendulae subsp. lavendulae]|nr:hypothetical protein Slala01_74730 [Streptomyces lavendulae subsp. lavendulae]GLX31727.1 hypothetical protein Slala02_75460 [Streptomyces lavendulae subsp. lavendulae]